MEDIVPNIDEAPQPGRAVNAGDSIGVSDRRIPSTGTNGMISAESSNGQRLHSGEVVLAKASLLGWSSKF